MMMIIMMTMKKKVVALERQYVEQSMLSKPSQTSDNMGNDGSIVQTDISCTHVDCHIYPTYPSYDDCHAYSTNEGSLIIITIINIIIIIIMIIIIIKFGILSSV